MLNIFLYDESKNNLFDILLFCVLIVNGKSGNNLLLILIIYRVFLGEYFLVVVLNFELILCFIVNL